MRRANVLAPLCLIAVVLSWPRRLLAVRNTAFIGWTEQHKADYKLIITTAYGKITILPRVDISPKVNQQIADVARKGSCTACNFYRHEPVPDNWGAKTNYWGPPYALLQGSLADIVGQPPFEGNPIVKKGDVCMIPNCKEFFIATADHDEWGMAHTVWGQVRGNDSWATIQAIPVEPFTTATDSNNITTRWLKPEAHIKFSLSIEPL